MQILKRALQFAMAPFRAAKRAIDSLPWNMDGDDDASSGQARKALTLVPFFAAVRILSEQISSLPLVAYRVSPTGELSMVKRSVPALAKSPSTIETAVAWKRKLVTSLCLRGNAYGYILSFDKWGQPERVDWLNPDDVHVDDIDLPNGKMRPDYWVAGRLVPYERILHIAWFVQPGSVIGLSPVANFARTIGVGLEATNFGATWFEHGGAPPGTFKNTARTLTPQQTAEMSARLDRAMRKRKPLVYGNDWDYKAIEVSPEESQFIETMQLNATQIATIFGVPPEMVGGMTTGSLTYSTKQGDGQALYKFTVRPWLVMIEEAISERMRGNIELRFDADDITRVDELTRYRAYNVGIMSGFLTPNEVRVEEGLPPIEGGDALQRPQAANDTGNPGTPTGDTDSTLEDGT